MKNILGILKLVKDMDSVRMGEIHIINNENNIEVEDDVNIFTLEKTNGALARIDFYDFRVRVENKETGDALWVNHNSQICVELVCKINSYLELRG